MDCFDLKKVIDPHKHMPANIKEALHEYARECETNNDYYWEWEVGKYGENDTVAKVVDNWLLEHFAVGERVVIRYWW